MDIRVASSIESFLGLSAELVTSPILTALEGKVSLGKSSRMRNSLLRMMDRVRMHSKLAYYPGEFLLVYVYDMFMLYVMFHEYKYENAYMVHLNVPECTARREIKVPNKRVPMILRHLHMHTTL